MSLVNCSRINPYVDIPIWSYPLAVNKSANFAYYFHLFNSIQFTKISLIQNDIRKSWNNTLASPVREIKSNLGKIAHFIVKEIHRLHNSVTELDTAKLTSCLFQCLALFNFLNGSLMHTKHNLSISNNLDEIWFWKNIPITFSQGCTKRLIYTTSLVADLWENHNC